MSYSFNWQLLGTLVDNRVISMYQQQSLASLFPSEQIPNGIAVNEWVKSYLKRTQEAAWTSAGYNPNRILVNFDDVKYDVWTISQEVSVGEQDLARFQAMGSKGLNQFALSVERLGENLARTLNRVLMYGKDQDGNAPFSLYNFILDGGGSTAQRPDPAYDATSAGAWSTDSDFKKDVANLIGEFEADGYSANRAILLYPDVAAPVFRQTIGTDNHISRINYILEQGIMGAIPVDRQFFPKADLSTAPTSSSFDMVLIDPSEYVIGYTRPERTRLIPPHDDIRDTKAEAEVWGVFVPLPMPRDINGTVTYTKAMSRIKDCAP